METYWVDIVTEGKRPFADQAYVYNFFFSVTHHPNSDLGRLIAEVSKSHTIRHTHTHTRTQ